MMRIAARSRSMVTLALFVGVLVLGSNRAWSTEVVQMKADLEGKGHGQAVFVATEKHRALKLHVRNSVPGMYFTVAVHRGPYGEKLGWLRTDKRGRAWLYLDTSRGDALPMLQGKDMIKLWYGDQSVMFGHFDPVQRATVMTSR